MTIMEGRARDWERPDFGGYRTGPKRICENADRRLGYLPIDYRDFGPHRLLFKTVGSHRMPSISSQSNPAPAESSAE
jgi:hypothetical protein